MSGLNEQPLSDHPFAQDEQEQDQYEGDCTHCAGDGEVECDDPLECTSAGDPVSEPMNAGRELDALVAEKVMGYQWRRWPAVYDHQKPLKGLPIPSEAHFWEDLQGDEMVAQDFARTVPHFSTDIAAAWDVVEKFEIRHIMWGQRGHYGALGMGWHAMLGRDGRTSSSEAPTAPHAICLAALKASGAPEGERP